MPKSANQKLRLLFEREILLRETDEENPITTKQLISRLEDCGVQAERKTIYSDIESLSLYGMDIIKVSGKNGGYGGKYSASPLKSAAARAGFVRHGGRCDLCA